MALNYQRNSFMLWESALETFKDPETRITFDIAKAAELEESELKALLAKYRLAIQPNKHTQTWLAIAKTVHSNFGTMQGLFEDCGKDFPKLRETVQVKLKKGFPYLSGPKIFNYWSFIIQEYGKIGLENSEFIEIAPDTHVIKCSVRLGVITQEEADKLSREKISEKWRSALEGSGISPIEMHEPLWFWSKGNFAFKV